MSSDKQYLSVSQFNRNLHKFFKNEPSFKQIHIKGEVSSVSISSSGHLYFNLKDKRSSIPCVIYRQFRKDFDFKIKNGMKLLVIANVNLYVPYGKCQLDVIEAHGDGLGRLYVKYQQIKEKLEKEGLFKEEFKKALSEFPERIGVVTSRKGSVVHDILKTVNDRWPYCQVILFPSSVQGASATSQLISQIKRADSFGFDVLIIARGGGSIEDLWCFNDEKLARIVFDCKTPVISAIGHERDGTLCDRVSDVSASNPTKAAVLAINDRDKVSSQLTNYNVRLVNYMSSKIESYKKHYDFMLSKSLFRDSSNVYGAKKRDFDDLCNRFEYSSGEIINSKRNRLDKIKSEYVIRYPCRIQLDMLSNKLNELQNRLIDSMDSIIKTNWHNLDNTTEEFRFLSDKFISAKIHTLDNIKSNYTIQNPLKLQINKKSQKLTSSKLV